MDYTKIIGSLVVVIIATIAFIKVNKELKQTRDGINRERFTIMLVILYLMSLIYAIMIAIKK